MRACVCVYMCLGGLSGLAVTAGCEGGLLGLAVGAGCVGRL